MQEAAQGFSFASLVLPIVIVALAVVGLGVLLTIARNYHKVSPNQVAVISGRKHKWVDPQSKQTTVRGYRVVTGGGFFQYPVVEKVEYLPLSNMGLPVSVQNAPDINGALVHVEAMSQVKILSDEASLALAIERFLGQTPEKIAMTAQQTLEGSLRAIVGTMSIEELIKDRAALQGRIQKEAASELAKLGLGIDVLTIKNISDPRNYIESMGKKRTAEVVRDATIGEAEAKRDGDIRSAQAQREGQTAQAKAAEEISNAERDRDTVKAENAALVQAKQAKIPIAAQVAAAEETKRLNLARVEAEKVRTQAETELQVLEKQRHDAQLEATIIVKAERDKQAKIISADADQQAASMTGEALRIKLEKEGQGQQAKQTAEAIGRKAAAEALLKEKEAEAGGKRAMLVAEADGEKASLLAKAEGQKAMLLAEAEGIDKKAEAFKKLDEAGRFLMILNALPPVIEAAGGAIEKIMVPAAKAIGEGLANVDEIRLIDLGGGGSSDGKNVLGKFAGMPVETLYELVNKLKATGMAPVVTELAKRFGVDLNTLFAGAPPTIDTTAHEAAADGATHTGAPAAGAGKQTKEGGAAKA